jgi:type VI secretion system protein ImpA
MGMTDLEALLRPVSQEARCGPDLDAASDPAYVELGVAAEWKEAKYVGEQQVSSETPPDWNKVKETASALLAVSKDLRIAKHYVAALAYTEGLPGFAAGVHFVCDLVERYWDALHPALDGAEDDWRKNLVMEFNSERGAFGGLRAAPIAESRKVGRFTLRDIEVLDGAAAPAGNAVAPTVELLREAVRDSDAAASRLRHESCQQALDDLQKIRAVFGQHQPRLGLEFPKVEKLLRRAQQILGDALGVESAAEGAAEGSAEASGKGAGNGPLGSRADARRVVANRFQQPAPLLIRRAARLLDLSFLDIIRDIAPGATTEIENLGGLKRE